MCQKHFSPDCFMNKEMNKLKPNAVPYKFDDNDQPSTSVGKNKNILHYIIIFKMPIIKIKAVSIYYSAQNRFLLFWYSVIIS